MTKIMPEHLARSAFVYVRQSTADQLLHNHESRHRQYGLADRARQLGWQEVTVIDDDLGRSGSGVSRPGFERLLAAICEGRAGAVFAIEASRLARNGRRLAHGDRVLWIGWRHHCRRRRRLRSSTSQRSSAARYERHNERAGAVDPAPTVTGSAEAEGAAW
jgi:hypothetical protein